MTIKFGRWASELALGEKLRAAEMKYAGYTDNEINQELEYYKDGSTGRAKQKTAEAFLELLGGSHSNSSALFGPIDRSKENTERMHTITLAMGADTGKHDHTSTAYNAAIVPLYIRQNPDGTYVLPSGGCTMDKEKAWAYTDKSEAESHRLSTQTIVEV